MRKNVTCQNKPAQKLIFKLTNAALIKLGNIIFAVGRQFNIYKNEHIFNRRILIPDKFITIIMPACALDRLCRQELSIT